MELASALGGLGGLARRKNRTRTRYPLSIWHLRYTGKENLRFVYRRGIPIPQTGYREGTLSPHLRFVYRRGDPRGRPVWYPWPLTSQCTLTKHVLYIVQTGKHLRLHRKVTQWNLYPLIRN